MTEVLSKGREFNPYVNYGPGNIPPFEEQSAFFKYAFLEGEEQQVKRKMARGPVYEDFVAIMEDVQGLVTSVDPSFGAEHIMPMSYQSPEVRRQVLDLEHEDKIALQEISRMRLSALEQASAKWQMGMSGQQIADGVLDVPFYAQQIEDWGNYDAYRGCTNACFRMVFGAITGWTPSQAAVSEQLIKQYGTSVVEDAIYSGVYHTEVFEETCDKHVVSIEMIGADFDSIARITQKIKQKYSTAEAYCTINLSSKNASKDIWHTCVLLGVDNGVVTYHDPSNSSGGAYQQEPCDTFLSRWAIAYNRAVITIAV